MALTFDEFTEVRRIEKKLENREPLTRKEKAFAKKYNCKGPTPCGCGTNCGLFLEPRVDGERPMLNGKEVNPDCYWREHDKDAPNVIGRGRRGGRGAYGD